MQTRVSTKGQVVLPSPLRRKLGLQPGDALDASLVSGRIVLTPRKTRSQKVRIVLDPLTGFPVLCAGSQSAVLTSRQVREILSTFP